MLRDKYNQNAKRIQELLTTITKQADENNHFVERRSKMDGAVFTQAMVLGCLQDSNSSLSQLIKISGKLGVTITAPGLDQRIDEEAVSMLAEVLQKSMQQLGGQERLQIEMLEHFTAVNLLDSTQVALPNTMSALFPGAGGAGPAAGVKIQLSYEYLRGELSAITLTSGIEPDQNCQLHLQQAQPGSLHLFDLGYFKQQVFAQLEQKGAFFISRFEHQTALYTDEAEPIRLELLDYLQQVKGDQHEVKLQMGRLVHLPVRVLFQRLPLAVVEERRRKAIDRMKHSGKQPSQIYLKLLEWQFFITNIPKEWLRFDQILLLYRVRWQIELVFKLWKSQANLDAIGNWRKDRILVHFYARLIGLVLFFALTAHLRWSFSVELSLPKAFKSFQEKIPAILRSIRLGWHSFFAVLSRLYAHWRHYDLKTHRVANPSTLTALSLAVC